MPGEELYWLERKTNYETDRDALLALGLPLETVKRLAGWQAAYDYETYLDSQSGVWPPSAVAAAPSGAVLAGALELRYARAASRANSGSLDESQLDAGVLYAVFIPDVPDLEISSIQFRLDGVPVHTEGSVPWDYDGTAFDGSANRVTFVAGPHIIDGYATTPFGIFGVSASFNVE